MRRAPIDFLTAHPVATPWWGRVATTYCRGLPSSVRNGTSDIGLLIVILIFVGFFGGALTTLVAKAVLGDPMIAPLASIFSVATGASVLYFAIAGLVGARWRPLEAEGIRQITTITGEAGREDWAAIVAQWVRVRPLRTGDLRVLKRADILDQAQRKTDAVDQEKREAMAALMAGPVGALAQAQALDETTAAAGGCARAQGRL